MYRAGTLLPAQTLHTFGNGTGRNQYDFAALSTQGGNLVRPIADGSGIQSFALVGDQTASHFNDNTLGLEQGSFHRGKIIVLE
jgi:hypothetical protein